MLRSSSLDTSNVAPRVKRFRSSLVAVAASLSFVLVSVGLGCDRAPEPVPAGRTTTEKPSQPPSATSPSPAPAPTRTAGGAGSSAPTTTRYAFPEVDHLVAIGDLHGDLEVTRKALKLAGAIDDSDRWIGGKLTIVQTGDDIDRGNEDRAVLDLLEKLRAEAAKNGGAVILLSGNHELMNVAFDFRYVTKPSYAEFDDVAGTDVDPSKLASVAPKQKGRASAFAPGGVYAKRLAERPVAVKVGSTVFAHGGVLPEHVEYGLDRINDEVRDWMLGKRPEPPAMAAGETGVTWTRVYSTEEGPIDCTRLRSALAALGAERMVVGHTPQRFGINSACDGKVWKIDTGMSHHYGGPVQVLDIEKSKVSVKK